MHVITRCTLCSRQYDTDGHDPGERFHCICGEILTVPAAKSDTASVVVCASCGGAREQGREQCGFCGTDFTLHEQDLDTVCPACLTRISNRARYCHHCATPIVISGDAGEPTSKPCPRCSNHRNLSSRKVESSGLSLLECNVCAGVWLDLMVFRELEQRMIELADSGITEQYKQIQNHIPHQRSDDQNLYRKCPTCSVLMHRRNYGPGSGIVIDQCHKHGFWFDLKELELILRWIRTGGLLASKKRRKKINKEQNRVAQLLLKIEENQKRYSTDLSEYYLGKS